MFDEHEEDQKHEEPHLTHPDEDEEAETEDDEMHGMHIEGEEEEPGDML